MAAKLSAFPGRRLHTAALRSPRYASARGPIALTGASGLIVTAVIALLSGCGDANESAPRVETTIERDERGPGGGDPEGTAGGEDTNGRGSSGGDDGETSAGPAQSGGESSEGGPIEPGPLAPGPHTTAVFVPTVRFTLAEGWSAPYSEEVDNFALRYDDGGDAAFVEVLRPQGVLRNHLPQGPVPTEEDVAPLADDLVRWFRGIPHLETSEPQPVTVGGHSGVRMTVRAEELPEDARRPWCPGPAACLALFPLESTGGLIVEDPSRNPIEYIFVDVEGEHIVISTGVEMNRPSSSDGEELRAKAQDLLDTFTFE